jgi:hypothetical protein
MPPSPPAYQPKTRGEGCSISTSLEVGRKLAEREWYTLAEAYNLVVEVLLHGSP